MAKIALLFPGQGAQSVGMGRALYEASPAARAVFDEVDDALGERLSATIFDGPADALMRTANTQPAILTVSIAAHRALAEALGHDVDAACAAGHSLGEYSALVATGAIALSDAARAVRARGTFMQEAVPEGAGAMAAVLGLAPDAIGSVLERVSTSAASVSVANFNGPSQTVIAGHQVAVDAALGPLKEAGAKRVMPLPVSAPFHCSLMAPVQPRLREVLVGLAVSAPTPAVVTNVDAAPNADAGRIVDLLVEQVVAPVRFTEMAERMLADDIDTFIELGPGKTLIGIIKRLDRGRTYLQAESPETVAVVAEALTK